MSLPELGLETDRQTALARPSSSSKLLEQTRPLVKEGAPHEQTRSCLEIIKREKLVVGPRWVPDTKPDWPTDRRS
jgi:hypothetical protein